MLKYLVPAIVVYADMRGAIIQELKYLNVHGILKQLKVQQASIIERKVIAQADIISCVSYGFKQYIEAKYDRHDIHVIPSCVNRNIFRFDGHWRKSLRKTYNVKDKIVFVYSGDTQGWQSVEYIFKLFSNYYALNANAHLLCLFSNPLDVTLYLEKYSLPKGTVTCHNAAYKDIYKYLSAADVGLLLRENNTVNNVASPLKFAEYLACKLPVIVTPGIGDTAKIIAEHGVGEIIDCENMHIDTSTVCRLIDEPTRERSLNAASTIFDLDINISKIVFIYKDILTRRNINVS